MSDFPHNSTTNQSLPLSFLHRQEGRSDPFEALEIQRNTTTANEIQLAYKRLALKHHPDKVQQGATAKARAIAYFSEISAAYELLTRHNTADSNTSLSSSISCPSPPQQQQQQQQSDACVHAAAASSQHADKVVVHPPLMAYYPNFSFTDPFVLFRHMFGVDQNQINMGPFGGTNQSATAYDTTIPGYSTNNNNWVSMPSMDGGIGGMLPPAGNHAAGLSSQFLHGSSVGCRSVASQGSSNTNQQQQQQQQQQSVLPDGRLQTVKVTKGLSDKGQEMTQTEIIMQYPGGRVESSTSVAASQEHGSSAAAGYLTDGSISTTNTNNSLHSFLLPKSNTTTTANSNLDDDYDIASDDTVAGDSENDDDGDLFGSNELSTPLSGRSKRYACDNVSVGSVLEIPPKRRRTNNNKKI